MFHLIIKCADRLKLESFSPGSDWNGKIEVGQWLKEEHNRPLLFLIFQLKPHLLTVIPHSMRKWRKGQG